MIEWKNWKKGKQFEKKIKENMNRKNPTNEKREVIN